MNYVWCPRNLCGFFRPDLDINYFCYICGNNGNRVIPKGLGAVIRLYEWDANIVSNLKTNTGIHIKFIPWFEKGSGITPGEVDEASPNPDLPNPTVIVAGFGKTD